MDEKFEEKWPELTFVLIVINLIFFLFTYNIFSNEISSALIEMFGLRLEELTSKPYTLITHAFIHSNPIHFSANILMLAILGIAIEEKIGKFKFLLIFLLSSFSTVLFALLLEKLLGSYGVLIGSSGAIYGLMFVAACVAGWEEVPIILVPLLNLIGLPAVLLTAKNIKIPLFLAILFYLLLNLILFVLNFPYSIVEFAHFGGFLGGIVGFFMVLPGKKEK